jgi:hypothetical protein
LIVPSIVTVAFGFAQFSALAGAATIKDTVTAETRAMAPNFIVFFMKFFLSRVYWQWTSPVVGRG